MTQITTPFHSELVESKTKQVAIFDENFSHTINGWTFFYISIISVQYFECNDDSLSELMRIFRIVIYFNIFQIKISLENTSVV